MLALGDIDETVTDNTKAGALQPVVTRNGLKNVPEKAYFSWEPTALLGIYRIDEFYWDRQTGKEARLQ